MPAMKSQTFCAKARQRKPRAPIATPPSIVGSGLRFFTIRLTTTCSRMIVPPLMTVTNSASNLNGRPSEAKTAFIGRGVDEVAEEPEDRPEVLEVEDPEERVDDDHEHEPGVAEDHRGAVGDVAELFVFSGRGGSS